MRIPHVRVALLVAALAPSALAQETRVLFLGNSYTAFNDLPALVAGLANGSGRTLIHDRHTPGGNTLGAPQGNGNQHVSNPTSLGKIAAGGWDAVVLQDQSTLPSIPAALSAWSIPAAASLAADIEDSNPGARVVLYQTWGRRAAASFSAAGQSVSFADFDAMQDALTLGYAHLAASAGGEVAPAGEAWRIARQTSPGIVLHANDGSHPTLAGSYLTACVFHARLFAESPVGNSFTAGLDPAVAAALQDAAAQAVLPGVEIGACTPTPNSVDPVGALLVVTGGTSITINTTRVEASGGVPGQFGLLVVGEPSLPSPLAAGALCIGSGLRRVQPPSTLDGTGAFARDLDFTAPPFVGAGALTAGDRLAVQLVYRDPSSPAVFNLSSAVVLTLQP